MGIKRLQYELKRLEALPLRHIIDEMASHGDSKVVMAFNGTQSQPVAAVALITGPDTAQHINALNVSDSKGVIEGAISQLKSCQSWLGSDRESVEDDETDLERWDHLQEQIARLSAFNQDHEVSV